MFWKIIGMSVPTSSVQLFARQDLGGQLDTKFRSLIFVRPSVGVRNEASSVVRSETNREANKKKESRPRGAMDKAVWCAMRAVLLMCADARRAMPSSLLERPRDSGPGLCGNRTYLTDTDVHKRGISLAFSPTMTAVRPPS